MMQSDFSALYRRYAPEIYRFALWLSGSTTEAEDLTSETFVRAWAGADDLRRDTLKSYLLTITRNLYREQGRRKKESVPVQDGPSSAPDPERRAMDRQRLETVRAALADLPEIDRTALILRVQGELGYADIARVLEISLSAAKVKVHRARLRLAARLKDEEAT